MLSTTKFTYLTYQEKINFLKKILEEQYQTSKIAKKIYFFITSEFTLSNEMLNKIYEGLYLAIQEEKEKYIKKNREKIQKIQKKETKEKQIDEIYLNNLLSKIYDRNNK